LATSRLFVKWMLYDLLAKLLDKDEEIVAFIQQKGQNP
jgi:hypothetical protein